MRAGALQLQDNAISPHSAGTYFTPGASAASGAGNYDAIGRWRTKDGSFTVDASGTLPNGKSFAGAAELKTILRADPSVFVKALAEKMLTYALGRGLETYDRATVQQIAQGVEKDGYKFSVLVQGIVGSVPFQQRRAAVESTEVAGK